MLGDEGNRGLAVLGHAGSVFRWLLGDVHVQRQTPGAGERGNFIEHWERDGSMLCGAAPTVT